MPEAGYPGGFKTTLTIVTTVNREVLTAIQTYLKEAGFDVTLDLADVVRYRQIATTGWKNGLLLPNNSSNANLSSFDFGHFPSTNNVSMYRGDWQKVLDQALAEPDYDKRTTLIKQLVKLHYDNAMTISIYAADDLSAVDKKLHDINWTQRGHPQMSTPADAWLSK